MDEKLEQLGFNKSLSFLKLFQIYLNCFSESVMLLNMGFCMGILGHSEILFLRLKVNCGIIIQCFQQFLEIRSILIPYATV